MSWVFSIWRGRGELSIRKKFREILFYKAAGKLTGTPSGRNRCKLLTGMIKQSRSSVAKEIGSLLELTKAPVAVPFCWPLKLTKIKKISLNFRFYCSYNMKNWQLLKCFPLSSICQVFFKRKWMSKSRVWELLEHSKHFKFSASAVHSSIDSNAALAFGTLDIGLCSRSMNSSRSQIKAKAH